MSYCHVSKQIAEHCDNSNTICPFCGEENLVEKSNVYGSWLECATDDCEYETEQQ